MAESHQSQEGPRMHVNMTIATPQNLEAVCDANVTAVDYNNHALEMSNAGDYQGALDWHLKALQLKIKAFGEESVQAAISNNAVGENYAALEQWEKAEEHMKRALRVRDELAMGPEFDAAVSRDNMAQIYEGQNRWEEAKEIRLKGSATDNIACGYAKCICAHSGFPLSKLQTCGACKSVFYCSQSCQRADWKTRHKPFCTKLSAQRVAA